MELQGGRRCERILDGGQRDHTELDPQELAVTLTATLAMLAAESCSAASREPRPPEKRRYPRRPKATVRSQYADCKALDCISGGTPLQEWSLPIQRTIS